MTCTEHPISHQITSIDHDIVQKAKKYSPMLVRGFDKGNMAVVHENNWLEVCDRKHRYGANLRAYYKEWKKLGCPNDFWSWLDGGSRELVEVPRTKLERETVLYCATDEERLRFALVVNNRVLRHTTSRKLINTGPFGWIFVLRDNQLYAGRKETSTFPRIHHTSFIGGECVQAAGMLVVREGVVESIMPHSGHYRPSDRELLRILEYFQGHDLDLSSIKVDVQRVLKVSRSTRDNTVKRKAESAYFWDGARILCFLRVKKLAWRVFDELLQQV